MEGLSDGSGAEEGTVYANGLEYALKNLGMVVNVLIAYYEGKQLEKAAAHQEQIDMIIIFTTVTS